MLKKFLIFFLAVIFTTAGATFSEALVNIGDEVPNLRLPDIEKSIFDLGILKGKKIILNFWASWSEPSLIELIYLEKNYDFFKNKNFEIVSINLDQRPAIAKFFAERRQLRFPVLIDLKLLSPEKYRLLVIPTTFIIDQNFKIKEILVNFDETIAQRLLKMARI